MAPEKAPKEPVGEEVSAQSLGLTFGLGIVMFAGAGYALDRWLGWLPVLTIAGTLVGAVICFIWVYQKVGLDQARYEREHPPRHRSGRKPPADDTSP